MEGGGGGDVMESKLTAGVCEACVEHQESDVIFLHMDQMGSIESV